MRPRIVLRTALLVLLMLVLTAAITFWLRPIDCFRQYGYLKEHFSGYQSSTVRVHGMEMHYLALGPQTGQPIVLIHGLGAQGEDWLPLAPSLAHAGYRVILPDLPGYGRSARPTDFSYSVHDESEMVVGFPDALGLTQVELGGWSMGGGIVQHVAYYHPERVNRLMLFDAVGLYQKAAWNVELFTPHSGSELLALWALLTPHPQPIPGFILRDALRHSQHNAWVVHRAVMSMLTGRDATDQLLPQLKMPTLIVWGTEDRIFPVWNAQKMHELVPQSQLLLVPGCGHRAPAECVPQIAPTVLAFAK